MLKDQSFEKIRYPGRPEKKFSGKSILQAQVHAFGYIPRFLFK